MTPKEFYDQLEEKQEFSELTNTGISDDYESVFDFAERYYQAKAKDLLKRAAESKMKNLEEIKKYLNDLDNLIDTGHFPNESVREFTYYNQNLTLKEFVLKGREIIRQLITETPI